MSTVTRLAAAAMALVLGAACQVAPSAGRALPPGPQIVEVTMREYRFDYVPPAGSGPTLFRVTNSGTVSHELEMLPLADDVPPIDVQLKGTQRRVVTPFAGVESRQPGRAGAFAVNLTPGVRYALICFLADPDGTSHAREGMTSEFRTTGGEPAKGPGAGQPAPPQ